MDRDAALSLSRLKPRLQARFAEADPAAWATFQGRLDAHFDDLFPLLRHLYGHLYDFFYHLESILEMAARLWLARPADLQTLDAERELHPDWFQSQAMLGGVCYVDLFAGNLAGIREKIPYFRELGLTYLHLMPLFAAPAGNSDGGYAVSSYRDVNPSLGTVAELADLAAELRRHGISLVVDFVFNHTSNEHDWALRARQGDPEYQDYYLMFPDRQMPDAYERTLREIFPEQRPGSFTWQPEMGRWVWTTFNSFQWDLHYANPVVFARMAEEMLSLANRGVEILRLDAVAFIWKQMGTSSENLPEAHMLIRAFNAIARIAAPTLLFKSEAIVHPDDVIKYISPAECQLSYNPLLMALLWNTLATREVTLLRDSLRKHFHINPRCAWVNYVRSHDDIGWTFDDAVAAGLGINGYDHRRFLNSFYTGRFAGSFARGVPFQENPRTGDARISGTCASLAGLEQAIQADSDAEIDLAIRRILLIHGVILTLGGIPLIYLGDEVGTMNDYCYDEDPAKAGDSRWIHRPFADWSRFSERHNRDTIPGRIYSQLHTLIALRKAHPAFAGVTSDIIETRNGHVFGYVRQHAGERVLCLANFSEQVQTVPVNEVRLYGLSYKFTDLISGLPLALGQIQDVRLEPYQSLWLMAG
jgi:amylosucrase